MACACCTCGRCAGGAAGPGAAAGGVRGDGGERAGAAGRGADPGGARLLQYAPGRGPEGPDWPCAGPVISTRLGSSESWPGARPERRISESDRQAALRMSGPGLRQLREVKWGRRRPLRAQ